MLSGYRLTATGPRSKNSSDADYPQGALGPAWLRQHGGGW